MKLGKQEDRNKWKGSQNMNKGGNIILWANLKCLVETVTN
jgi:hypothetical protein